jgi:1-acyl-sn-glycerol-3-phosphate acyltransferase
MAGPLRLLFVLVLFVLVTSALLPFQLIAAKAGRWWHKRLPHFWQLMMCKLIGLHVTQYGKVAGGRPLMLVSNHVSWSDILVLGSLAEVSFIAKNEVRHWPLFGMLASLQNTVFIERDKRARSGEQSREIADRLKSGDILVLFPEGTTSDGNRVLPIKSSLFGAARMALDERDPDAHMLIQPVSISYNRRHGLPLGRYHRPVAGWPGRVGLMPHLKGLVLAGSIGVDVTFGEPLPFDLTTDRKKMAATVQDELRRMDVNARLGRPLP